MRLVVATLLFASVGAGSAVAVELKQFQVKDIGLEISVPQGCRHVTTPGTIEAICAPSFVVSAARALPAAAAWLFEVDYEVAPADAPKYSLEAFTAEVPAMVCGTSDGDVRIANAREASEDKRTVFDAEVTCPAVSFLGLPERKAQSRVVISGQKRFRLMARTPSADAAKAEEAAKAFLASFKLAD